MNFLSKDGSVKTYGYLQPDDARLDFLPAFLNTSQPVWKMGLPK
jgi:hypothetical protein